MIGTVFALFGITSVLMMICLVLISVGVANGIEVVAWSGPLGNAAIVTSVWFVGMGVIVALEAVRTVLQDILRLQHEIARQLKKDAAALESEKATYPEHRVRIL